jgi:hypothetical protein
MCAAAGLVLAESRTTASGEPSGKADVAPGSVPGAGRYKMLVRYGLSWRQELPDAAAARGFLLAPTASFLCFELKPSTEVRVVTGSL